MKSRPILFSAPMVRALLDGSKTQTRRIFKPERIVINPHPKVGQYYETFDRRNGELVSTGQGPFIPNDWLHYCPYGQPGDQLWVKETYAAHEYYDGRKPTDIPEGVNIEYRAGGDINGKNGIHEGERGKWRPSLFMRRWMSRITLEIVSVRIERLNEISEADAAAEGVLNYGNHWQPSNEINCPCSFAYGAYRTLWESINGPGSWATNPWVWVIEFRKLS